MAPSKKTIKDFFPELSGSDLKALKAALDGARGHKGVDEALETADKLIGGISPSRQSGDLVMKTGGIFGHKALGMAGGGVFGGKPVSGTGCSCGTGAVVPDDFGVDLFKPSLPVTDEIMNEATLLEKEVAMANAAQGTALGLSGTQIALILGGVAIGVWMLTKGKRVKANRRRVKRRLMGSQKWTLATWVKYMSKRSDKDLRMFARRKGPVGIAAKKELKLRRLLSVKANKRWGTPRDYALYVAKRPQKDLLRMARTKGPAGTAAKKELAYRKLLSR